MVEGFLPFLPRAPVFKSIIGQFCHPQIYLDSLDFVGGFDVNLDFFSSQSFHLDQHLG